MHGQKVSAYAQQICTLRNQVGNSAWKSGFALRKTMPAQSVIRRDFWHIPLSKWTMRIGSSFRGPRIRTSAPLDFVGARSRSVASEGIFFFKALPMDPLIKRRGPDAL